MDAVAYPDQAVVSFITEHLVPLRIPADDPIYGPRYKIKWTPSLLILDADGVEHYRTLGFYPPQDLIPSLLLGIGKALFNRPDRPKACDCFQRLIDGFPKNPLAAEAVYLAGVSRYIETHDVQHLIGIYDGLTAAYPGSTWVMRAEPYKLLKKL